MRADVALAVSLAVALAHTPLARAEGDSREAQLRAEIVSIAPAMPGELRWALYADLIGDTDRAASATYGRAQAALGAEVALESDLCRLVVAGGQAQIYREGGGDAPAKQGLSGEQWASACLFSGSGLPLIELDHDLELSLRPALDSRLQLRPDRYSRETFNFRTIGLNYQTDDLRVELSSWNTGVSVLWQPGSSEGEMGEINANISGAIFRWVRPGRGFLDGERSLSVLPIDVEIAVTGSDASTMRVGPVRLEQYKLGSLPLYLDADVAWANGSVWSPDEASGEYVNSVEIDMLAADAALRLGNEAHSGGIRYQRSLTPTVDLELVAEDRFSAWASFRRLRTDVALHAFVASSLVLAASSRERFATGGLRATLDWPLGNNFHASLQAEAARSFYAVLDASQERRAAWAARALGVLSARFGNAR